jgi:hypothetical protein
MRQRNGQGRGVPAEAADCSTELRSDAERKEEREKDKNFE